MKKLNLKILVLISKKLLKNQEFIKNTKIILNLLPNNFNFKKRRYNKSFGMISSCE